MKKILLIGGTGTISSAITAKLAADNNFQLTLINRGNKSDKIPVGVEVLTGDMNSEAEIVQLLAGRKFDVVADFIAFGLDHVKRDFRLFKEITKQYIFISTASAYQKPPVDNIITESTPLVNPYWSYSREKATCEEWLLDRNRCDGFPVTIVRPSHTYSNEKVPLALSGHGGSWQVIRRMLAGKPVPIPGDGSSLWTMTHNTDFADGFIGLLGNPRAIGHAVHITSDEALTWRQIYETIAAKLGVELNPLFVTTDLLAHAGKKYGYDFEGSLFGDKAWNAVFDNSKIKRLVPGFTAKIRYDQGLDLAVDNILANPHLQTEDLQFDTFCDELAAATQEMYDKFAK